MFLGRTRSLRNIRTYVHRSTQEAEEHKTTRWPEEHNSFGARLLQFFLRSRLFPLLFFLPPALSLSSSAHLSVVQRSPRPLPYPDRCRPASIFSAHRDHIFSVAPPYPGHALLSPALPGPRTFVKNLVWQLLWTLPVDLFDVGYLCSGSVYWILVLVMFDV
jgi:hypothetical protein